MTRADGARAESGVAHVLIVLFVAVVALAAIYEFSDAAKPGTKALSAPAPKTAGVSPRRAALGASVAAPSDGGPGAVVVEVQPGGPAAAAGINAGDLIAAVDGRAVTTPNDIATVLARHQPNDTVPVQWFDAAHVYHTASALLAAR